MHLYGHTKKNLLQFTTITNILETFILMMVAAASVKFVFKRITNLYTMAHSSLLKSANFLSPVCTNVHSKYFYALIEDVEN